MEEEKPERIISEQTFDLYTHMKINIKCNSANCEIHDSDFSHYCLTCRRPICDVCRLTFHTSHSTQLKSLINFNIENLGFVFKELEDRLKSTRILVDPLEFKNELKNIINNEFEEIENLLKGLKTRKLNEIDLIFSDVKNVSNLHEYVKENKKKMSDYFIKYNDYYYSADVKDEDNTIFLQTYDIYNMCLNASDYYNCLIKNLDEYYNNYAKGIGFKYNNVKVEIEKALEEERKNEIMISNAYMYDKKSNDNLLIKNESSSNKIEIKLEKLSSKEMNKKNISQMFDKLNEDLYGDVKDRINKTQDFIDLFKKTTFESFKKHGSLVDIEKTVKIFDEKTNKRTNFIKGKAKLNFSPSQAKAYSTSGVLPSGGMTRSKATLGVNNSNGNIRRDTGVDQMQISQFSENSKKEDSKEKKDKSKDDKKVTEMEKKSKNKADIIEKKYKTDVKGKSKGLKLESLREEDDEIASFSEESSNSKNDASDLNMSDNSSDNEEENEEFEDEIKLENGYGTMSEITKNDKKLSKMFKPLKKKAKLLDSKKKNSKKVEDNKSEKKKEEKYKVNNKLQELIKENQKLCATIKKKEDITIGIPLIRRYYSYLVLEFIRKNFFKLGFNGGQSHNIIDDVKEIDEDLIKDSIKIFDGTNEIQVFSREKRKIIKQIVNLSKKEFGFNVFPCGSRMFYYKDKAYITGGKDINQEYKVFLMYSIKENKLYRFADMIHSRCYHTMVYHENLKSILVFGGENNKTCEMFDFFLNSWSELPELNIPRSNIGVFIDKIGTFAYAFCGQIGSILNSQNTDVIELLDLVDMNQGWAKVEYCNKANVDFKFSNTGVFPLTDDKILLYGANESRKTHKCFVFFNLRTFDVTMIDKETLENLRMNALKNPELSRIFI